MEHPDLYPDPASPALSRAIEQWQAGYPISLTLAAELMAEGLDVLALESKYLN